MTRVRARFARVVRMFAVSSCALAVAGADATTAGAQVAAPSGVVRHRTPLDVTDPPIITSELPWLDAGTRIRVVTRQASTPIVGEVVRESDDSLYVRGARSDSVAVVAVARGDVLRADQAFRETNAAGFMTTTLAGLLGGFVLGTALVKMDETRCEHGPGPHEMCGFAAMGMLIYVPAGLLTGAIVGAMYRHEVWRELWTAPSAGAQRLAPSGVVHREVRR